MTGLLHGPRVILLVSVFTIVVSPFHSFVTTTDERRSCGALSTGNTHVYTLSRSATEEVAKD